MTKWAAIGGAVTSGVLLALVIVLSIRIGQLRREVKDGDALVAAITQQRDGAMKAGREREEEVKLAKSALADAKAKAAQSDADREVVEQLLSDSRERIRALKAQREPTSQAGWRERERTLNQHVALLEDDLKLQSQDLRWNKEALAVCEHGLGQCELAVADYKEALRLETARADAVEYVSKQKKRKRILWGVVGGIVVTAAAFGGGYALGKVKNHDQSGGSPSALVLARGL